MIASAEALRGGTATKDLRPALRKLGEGFKGFLAFTDGADGIYWLDDGEVRHMPAFKVKAVDTLGAGDVFHAAFAFHLVETGDLIGSDAFCRAPPPPSNARASAG